MMFITHDLGVVANIADEVAVMYLGKIVEQGPVRSVFRTPRHPYTRGLLASIPSLGGPRGQALVPIRGSVPNSYDIPAGCVFAPRCPMAVDACRASMPALQEGSDGHKAACWLHGEGSSR
jgi:oligopeptide/dipeptide ABC transporter ATP-binding protein